MDPLEALKKEIIKGLNKAGTLMVSECRNNLNTAQDYVRVGANFRGLNPSKPGSFPHKLSGQLLKSVAYVVDENELVLTVGTNLPHGKFTELGTMWMAPRPWLQPTVEANYPKIAGFFSGQP